METGDGTRAVDRLPLGGAVGGVGRCRDFVTASLAARGWLDGAGDEELTVVEDVLLMTSELVTNASLHAGGAQELTVSVTGDRLRIEVADASEQPPQLRRLGPPSRLGGHGLRVVQQLAAAWGSEPRAGGGKVVWFEVDRIEVDRA